MLCLFERCPKFMNYRGHHYMIKIMVFGGSKKAALKLVLDGLEFHVLVYFNRN